MSGKRKSALPAKADEAKRQLMNWNMTDLLIHDGEGSSTANAAQTDFTTLEDPSYSVAIPSNIPRSLENEKPFLSRQLEQVDLSKVRGKGKKIKGISRDEEQSSSTDLKLRRLIGL